MKLRYVWVEESSHITAGIPHNDIGTFSFKASLLSLNEDSTIQFESASNTSLSVGQLIVAGGSGIHYLYSLQVIVAETFNLNGFLEPVPSSSETKEPSENTKKEIYIQADFLEGGSDQRIQGDSGTIITQRRMEIYGNIRSTERVCSQFIEKKYIDQYKNFRCIST